MHVNNLIGHTVDVDGQLCGEKFLRAADVDIVLLVDAFRSREDFALWQIELCGEVEGCEHLKVR